MDSGQEEWIDVPDSHFEYTYTRGLPAQDSNRRKAQLNIFVSSSFPFAHRYQTQRKKIVCQVVCLFPPCPFERNGNMRRGPCFENRSLMESRSHRDLMPISFKPPWPIYSQAQAVMPQPSRIAGLHLQGATIIKHLYLHNIHPCTEPQQSIRPSSPIGPLQDPTVDQSEALLASW